MKTTNSKDLEFISTIKKSLLFHGFREDIPVVVGVSGGKDSSALLVGMSICFPNTKLVAAHFEHLLRPKNKHELKLIQEVAEYAKVDQLVIDSADTKDYAKRNGLSLEMAGRYLRYKFLEETSLKTKSQGVVVGHNKKDQVETVLMNTMRGTGLEGVCGMKHVNKRLFSSGLPLWRPMLDVDPSIISAFCSKRKLATFEDESNKEKNYTRNRIRLELLPLLEDIRGGSTNSIHALSKRAQSDLYLIEKTLTKSGFLVHKEKNCVWFDRHLFRKMDQKLMPYALKNAFFEAGFKLGLESKHICQVVGIALSKKSNLSLDISKNLRVFVSKNEVKIGNFVDKKNLSLQKQPLIIGKNLKLFSDLWVRAEIVSPPKDLATFEKNVAYVDPIYKEGLLVRSRINGDTFVPLGMQNKVKLQNFFVNSKVPRDRRDEVPLVDSPNGILWVAGYRIADWAKLKKSSEKALKLSLTKAT